MNGTRAAFVEAPIEVRCASVDELCGEVIARLEAGAVGFEMGAVDAGSRLIEHAGRIAHAHLVEAGIIDDEDHR